MHSTRSTLPFILPTLAAPVLAAPVLIGALWLATLALAPSVSAAPPVEGSSVGIGTAVDQNGNRHRWAAEAGAVTIIDFAASWCGPCHESLPRLEAFAEQHPEVRVLVISVDDEIGGRDRLVSDLGLTLPVLWDEDHRAAEHYRPEGMPATFVYDAAGEPVLTQVGSRLDEWQTLERTVEGLLDRPRG